MSNDSRNHNWVDLGRETVSLASRSIPCSCSSRLIPPSGTSGNGSGASERVQGATETIALRDGTFFVSRKPLGDVVGVTTVTTTLAPSEPRPQLAARGETGDENVMTSLFYKLKTSEAIESNLANSQATLFQNQATITADAAINTPNLTHRKVPSLHT